MQIANRLKNSDNNQKQSGSARLIRNVQATAMLEASLALHRTEKNYRDGADINDVMDDIRMISRFLRDSAF